MKNGQILKQNNTHKAVVEIRNGKKVIAIYTKGMTIDMFEGEPNQAELPKEFPHWFKDEYQYSILLENRDDLFAIFERLDEDNRINLAEANEALQN